MIDSSLQMLAISTINVLLSVLVFELILKIQNTLQSFFVVSLLRKLSVLAVFLLMTVLFQSLNFVERPVQRHMFTLSVIVWAILVSIYLFRFFFPRQRRE